MNSAVIPNEVIAWFRESATYIEHHRNKTLVICITGEFVANGIEHLARDLITLHHLGIKVVLVHGGRPQIEQALSHHHIHTDFVQGMRLTSKAAMNITKQILGGVASDIVAQLSAQPSELIQLDTAFSAPHKHSPPKPLTVCQGNFITAQPIGVVDGVDHLFTGKVRKVNHTAIQELLDMNNIVLISSMGYSPSGESFNLTVEETAVAVAKSLHADKLIFFIDTHSLTNAPTPKAPLFDPTLHRINVLTPHDARECAQHVPEYTARSLTYAADACEQGVERVHILEQSLDGALFSELYTRDGVGTMVTNDTYQHIRPAQLDDVSGIISLLKPMEAQGVVVYRSREQIELDIEKFTVMVLDGKVIGCVALYPYQADGMAEIACMITAPEYNKSGRGSLLLNTAMDHASALGLSSVFVLTTQTEHWFKERGFKEQSPDQLPMDKQSLYNWQRQSKVLFKSL